MSLPVHPATFTDADQIWPGMWLGGYPGNRVDPEVVVICAFPNFAQPHPDGVHLSFGMQDEEGAVPSRDYLDAMVSAVGPWVRMGRTTFWHCQAGLNRSAFLLAYFMCSTKGLSAEVAIAAIRHGRPGGSGPGVAPQLQPLFNQSFAAALRLWFPGS